MSSEEEDQADGAEESSDEDQPQDDGTEESSDDDQHPLAVAEEDRDGGADMENLDAAVAEQELEGAVAVLALADAAAAVADEAAAAPPRRCWACMVRSNHTIDECVFFTSKTLEQRAQWARNNSQCFRCLDGEHQMKYCPRQPECSMCQGWHHDLLHHAPRVTRPSGDAGPINMTGWFRKPTSGGGHYRNSY